MKTQVRILAVNLLFLTLAVSGWTQTRSRSAAPEKTGATSVSAAVTGGFFNVRLFGAKGDGKALDSAAINKAIDAAAAKGGGTVFFPAGTYRSFSIRLKSNITLYFDQGSTLLAADPNDGD